MGSNSKVKVNPLPREGMEFVIADPDNAIRRCFVLLTKGLHFEDPILLAELVKNHTITPDQFGVLNNGQTAKGYRWGILSEHLLRLLPGEVNTFFRIILRLEGAIPAEMRTELIELL